MIDPLEEACLISAYGCIRLQPSFSGTRNKKVMWVPLFFMVALTKVYCLKFSARYIVIIDHFKKKIHSNSVSKLFFFNLCFFWLYSLTFLVSQLRSDPFLIKTWEQTYMFSQVKGEEPCKCIWHFFPGILAACGLAAWEETIFGSQFVCLLFFFFLLVFSEHLQIALEFKNFSCLQHTTAVFNSLTACCIMNHVLLDLSI